MIKRKATEQRSHQNDPNPKQFADVVMYTLTKSVEMCKNEFLILPILFKITCSAHAAKFYGQLRSICSVLKAINFFVLKLTEIVIFWDYYTIPFSVFFFW